MKKRAAWVITWKWMGETRKPDKLILHILPPRWAIGRIEDYMKALYLNSGFFLVPERFDFFSLKAWRRRHLRTLNASSRRAHGCVSRPEKGDDGSLRGAVHNAIGGRARALSGYRARLERILRRIEEQPRRRKVKFTVTLAALFALAASALADTYCVHYSVRGSGRDITVQAATSAEVRRTVMDMMPSAVVTSAHRIK